MRDVLLIVFSIAAPMVWGVPCHYKEMTALAAQESRKSIARSDSARGTCYKSISGHVWGDPYQYELSVDSSIGPE